MAKLFKEGFIESNNDRIHYLDIASSNSEVLVFIHGNGEDSSYFTKQYQYFMRRYRIISIDSRGHGLSTLNTNNLTIDMIGSDIFKVITKLGIDKATFIGFSDGANALMSMAINYPQIIDKLILIGGNVGNKGLKTYLTLMNNAEHFATYLLKDLKLSNEYNNQYQKVKLMTSKTQYTLKDLNKIKAKTLIIASDNDMIKRKHTLEIQENIKDSTLYIVKNANHFAIYNKAEELNLVIDDFINLK